jgi:hypothetical protein
MHKLKCCIFFHFFKLAICFGIVVPFPVATYSFKISRLPWQMWFVGALLQIARNYGLLENLMCSVLLLFWRENEYSYTIFPTAQQPLLCRGLLIIEASWSHSDTPHSVELLWTSDQPDPETSTWQHETLTIDTYMPPVEFEPTISESERLQTHTIDRHHRPYGHWHKLITVVPKLCSAIQRDPRPVPRGSRDIFL